MKKRVQWLDIAKFIAIFAVYLGHFGSAAGLGYSFVFKFHVPLFFFLSGCAESFSKETSFLQYTKKKYQTIMIPFFCFALLSIIIFALREHPDIKNILYQIYIVLRGCVRNTFFAASLWFLSCLFLVAICFFIIKKVRNKILIIIISTILFSIAEFGISPRPIVQPHMLYNFDSMLFYIIFYALGYVLFRPMQLLFELNTLSKKSFYIILSITTGLFTLAMFYNYPITAEWFSPIIDIYIHDLFTPIIIILFVCLLSRILAGLKYVPQWGTKTLFLCGNEYIVKELIFTLISLCGFNIEIQSPLQVCIFIIIAFSINLIIIIPIEVSISNMIKNKFFLKLFSKQKNS